jgi:hypothetical protein
MEPLLNKNDPRYDQQSKKSTLKLPNVVLKGGDSTLRRYAKHKTQSPTFS